MSIIDDIAGRETTQQVVQAAPKDPVNVMGLLIIILITMFVMLGLFLIFILIRNKYIYKYPVVLEERIGDARKIRLGKGGWRKKKGYRKFHIKSGWWLRKWLEVNPDTNLMDAEGRLHFDRLDPDTYVQKRVIHLKRPDNLIEAEFIKEHSGYKIGDRIVQYKGLLIPLLNEGVIKVLNEEERTFDVEDVYLEPIPSHTKENAVSEIKNLENMLRSDSLRKALMIGGGLILLAMLVFGIYMAFGR